MSAGIFVITSAVIGAITALLVASFTPTIFQAAKQAIERDANVKYSLLVLDGTLRNISRHYIRTGGRLINPNPVDALTLKKATINFDYNESQIRGIINIVGSSKITFGLNQILLLLRNYNLEIEELTAKEPAAPIDQSKIPRILGVGLFLAQACHTAAEDIENYRKKYTARNISLFYPIRKGTTPMVANIDDFISISTVRKRKSDLLMMCDDYLDGEDDKHNRMLLQKFICETTT